MKVYIVKMKDSQEHYVGAVFDLDIAQMICEAVNGSYIEESNLSSITAVLMNYLANVFKALAREISDDI